MPNGVTKESYQKMGPDDKLNVLYDQQQELYESVQEIKKHENCIWANCDERFKKIESLRYKVAGIVVTVAAFIPIIAALVAVMGGWE